MNKCILFLVPVVFFMSCGESKQEISTRFMNSKCKVEIGKTVTMDGLDGDSIPLAELDSLIMANIIDSFPADFAGKIYFHGKKKLGHLRLYSVLLDEGNSRSIHAVIVKDKLAVSSIELASFGLSEVHTYSSTSSFMNDSTILTRRYESAQTDGANDEPTSGDSVITVSRILKSGDIQVLSCDTLQNTSMSAAPDDDEYSDEVFFYDGVSPTSWAVAGISNQVAFKNFFMEFRTMVKLNNKDEIANYIEYPIKNIENEAAFVKSYDNIFTPGVKQAIIKQKIRQIYRDDRGVMIGDNILWIRQIKGSYKVVKINN